MRESRGSGRGQVAEHAARPASPAVPDPPGPRLPLQPATRWDGGQARMNRTDTRHHDNEAIPGGMHSQ
jgi:hypothetical protein